MTPLLILTGNLKRVAQDQYVAAARDAGYCATVQVLGPNDHPKISREFTGLVVVETTYLKHSSYYATMRAIEQRGLSCRVLRCGPARFAGELSRAAHGLRRDHPQEDPMKGTKKGGKGGKMPPGKGGKC